MGLHSSIGLERCSANAEAMGLNPVEPEIVFELICNCLNFNYHCDDHVFSY